MKILWSRGANSCQFHLAAAQLWYLADVGLQDSGEYLGKQDPLGWKYVLPIAPKIQDFYNVSPMFGKFVVASQLIE